MSFMGPSGSEHNVLLSPSNSIQRWLLLKRLSLPALGVLIGLAAWWAFSSQPPMLEQRSAPLPLPVLTTNPTIALDTKDFAARLWTPDPPPPPPVVATNPTPAPPPKPPLQLVAVLDAATPGGPKQVAIYDPAADATIFAVEGDRVGEYIVLTIADQHVILHPDKGPHVMLKLQAAEAAAESPP